MPTRLTIPSVDILGSKKGYSAEEPWLFEDFDQITFYEVPKEEYEKRMAIFGMNISERTWSLISKSIISC
jgi:urea carboxylase